MIFWHRVTVGRPIARRILAALSLAALAACTAPVTRQDGAGAILLIGDDLLSANAETLSAALQAETGRTVLNRAADRARATHPRYDARLRGRAVPSQYQPAAYEWVVVTGGAEDLMRECRCRDCGETLDEVIGLTGRTGALPPLVARIRRGEARVLLLGYAPGTTPPGCQDDVRELNNRMSRLADLRNGVRYVAAAQAITPETPAAYAGQRLSPAGSEILARLIAQTLAAP